MRRQYTLPLELIMFLLFCLGAEFFVFKAQATSPNDVVINEIAWMGTTKDWQYEWIELFNNGDTSANLSNWKIENAETKQGTLEITQGEVLPQNYFVICKKKMEKCDLELNKLSLHNNYKNNGRLILKDGKENITDQTPEANNNQWPTGSNQTKQTMERIDASGSGDNPDNWQTSQDPGGTPKAKNSIIDSGDTSPAINYIVINELLPDPEGTDQEGEFIELFNNSDTTTDLSSFQIKDKTASSFTINPGTTMPGYSYLAFYTGSKFLLNNSGDTVFLIRNNETLEEINYTGPVPKNQSYNRTSSGWQWSTTTTPGTKNIITTDATYDSSSQTTYPRHIWISEFLPDPEGKDTEGELTVPQTNIYKGYYSKYQSFYL